MPSVEAIPRTMSTDIGRAPSARRPSNGSCQAEACEEERVNSKSHRPAQVPRWGGRFASSGSAVDTAQVAMVGETDAQIVNFRPYRHAMVG